MLRFFILFGFFSLCFSTENSPKRTKIDRLTEQIEELNKKNCRNESDNTRLADLLAKRNKELTKQKKSTPKTARWKSRNKQIKH